MDNQQEIMLLIGAMMTEDQIINDLKESIKVYHEEINDEKKAKCLLKIYFNCLLLLNKHVAPSVEEAHKLAIEMKNVKKMMDLTNLNSIMDN